MGIADKAQNKAEDLGGKARKLLAALPVTGTSKTKARATR